MKKLKTIVTILDDVRLTDIIVYDMREVNPFFDYFILSTAKNTRQLSAAIRETKHGLEAIDEPLPKIEGSGGAWALIDANDIIINVFTETERSYYNIEKMWLDVPQIDIASL